MSRPSGVLIVILAAAALLPAAACRGEPRVQESAGAPAGASGEAPAMVPAHPPTPVAGAGMVPPAELVWAIPEGWKEETPASAMRKAQYRLPAAAGDPEGGECAVFYFSAGQGGDVQGNIGRWAGQFRGPGGAAVEPVVTELKAGGLTITRVEVKGTYTPSPMMMGGGATPPEKPGYMLLGGIVPGAQANWFFRCAGPEKTMTANRPRFDALLASIRLPV